jgi:hypothetical protein
MQSRPASWASIAVLASCLSVIDVQKEKPRVRDAITDASKDTIACADRNAPRRTHDLHQSQLQR